MNSIVTLIPGCVKRQISCRDERTFCFLRGKKLFSSEIREFFLCIAREKTAPKHFYMAENCLSLFTSVG